MIRIDLRELAGAHRPGVVVSDELRKPAIATWLGRMTNEYQSSFVFDALAAELEACPELAEHAAEARAFAEEERRHGILCGAVVEALGGQAVTSVDNEPDFPTHAEVEIEEAILRNLMSISCLSETVAVSLIGAEREVMPEGELKTLLTSIWADEIGHARFGWRLVVDHVPRLAPDAKRRMSGYLRASLRHLERHELSHLPERGGFGEGAEAIGLCSGRDARTLFYATVVRVILPRLGGLGLDASWAWQTRHAHRAAA